MSQRAKTYSNKLKAFKGNVFGWEIPNRPRQTLRNSSSEAAALALGGGGGRRGMGRFPCYSQTRHGAQFHNRASKKGKKFE